MTRPDELPRVLLERGFDRLEGVFGSTGKLNREGWVWATQTATRGWTEEEFQAAVRVSASECRFFPRPRDVAERRPFKATPVATEDGPTRDECRSCDQHRYYAGYRLPDGTIGARLRCDCPQPGSGWDHPEALAWVEDKPELVAAGYVRRPTARAA